MEASAEEKKRRRLEAWRRKKAQDQLASTAAAQEAVQPPLQPVSKPPAEADANASGPEPRDSVFGADDERAPAAAVGTSQAATVDAGDEEADPLDAFMEQLGAPEGIEAEKNPGEVLKSGKEPNGAETQDEGDLADQDDGKPGGRDRRRKKRQYDTSSDEEEYAAEDTSDAAWAKRTLASAGGPKKLSKGEKMGNVDHQAMDYKPFRRAFYIEVPELQRMDEAAVREYRGMNGIKVKGKRVPKPLRTWIQAGLPTAVVNVLREKGFEAPLPIQSQALPVILSGRDCMAVAKTGSGKTMSFVLPMIRHVKDQPPLAKGDGPIAMIMAPTRELVQQIGKEIKMVAKVLGMRCTPVFGGSGIASQIADLKRGSEIVVCTPGRMIDILASGNKSVTNLSRVTYLVMDEADRLVHIHTFHSRRHPARGSRGRACLPPRRPEGPDPKRRGRRCRHHHVPRRTADGRGRFQDRAEPVPVPIRRQVLPDPGRRPGRPAGRPDVRGAPVVWADRGHPERQPAAQVFEGRCDLRV